MIAALSICSCCGVQTIEVRRGNGFQLCTKCAPSPRVHELKTWPDAFAAVWARRKLFEFRKDDRGVAGSPDRGGGFREGDVLFLREFEPDLENDDAAYSGRQIAALVTHVERGPQWGIPHGYACMSITPFLFRESDETELFPHLS